MLQQPFRIIFQAGDDLTAIQARCALADFAGFQHLHGKAEPGLCKAVDRPRIPPPTMTTSARWPPGKSDRNAGAAGGFCQIGSENGRGKGHLKYFVK